MLKLFILILVLIGFVLPKSITAQVDDGQIGAWYIYQFSSSPKNQIWSVRGDAQLRNWNMMGDLEQLVLRGGLYIKPWENKLKFGLGYGHVTNGSFGDDRTVRNESRIHQDIILPVKIGQRFYTKHRIRVEERFIDRQKFRTRYRYNFGVAVPLNKKTMDKHTIYLDLSNEFFVNGELSIGNDQFVRRFDRNRLFLGVGYYFNNRCKIQLDMMNQTTSKWSKNQVVLSLTQKF